MTEFVYEYDMTDPEGAEEYRPPGIGTRGAKVPSRQGVAVITGIKKLEVVPTKKDKSKVNFVVQGTLRSPDPANEPDFKEVPIQQYDYLSGTYYAEGKYRPGQSRMAILRDVLVALGMDVEVALKAVPPAKSGRKVNLTKINEFLAKKVSGGAELPVSIRVKEDEIEGKGIKFWRTEIQRYLAPEKMKKAVELNLYREDLPQACKDYLAGGNSGGASAPAASAADMFGGGEDPVSDASLPAVDDDWD